MSNIISWREWDGKKYRIDHTGQSGLIVDGQRVWIGDYVVVEHDLDIMTETERVDLFRAMTACHDYWYMMADDHDSYIKGHNWLEKIKRVGQTIDRDLANKIWVETFSHENYEAPLLFGNK